MREKEWLKISLKMLNFFKIFKLIKNIPKSSWSSKKPLNLRKERKRKKSKSLANKDKKNILKTYIVKKGDTLYSISKKLKITVDDIVKINNISGNNLSIGQILKLK